MINNKLKKLLKIDCIFLICAAIIHAAVVILAILINVILIQGFDQSSIMYTILYILVGILLLASIAIITILYPIYLLVTNIIAAIITQKYRRVFSLIGYIIVASVCGFVYTFYYFIDNVNIYYALTASVLFVSFILPSIIHIIHHYLDSRLLTK